MRWLRWLIGLLITLLGLKLYSTFAVWWSKAKHPPVGQFVTVDGVRLHYVRQGAGQPVVLLHATGLTLQDFTLSIFDQVAAQYQVLAFDRPGYGYSERPAGEPLSLALNARLLYAALQALEITKPILVGHSSGGSVALRYALDYPDDVASLVLLAPSTFAQGLSVPPLFYLTETPVLGPLFLNTVLTPLARLLAPLFIGSIFAPNPPPAGYTATLAAFALRPSHFRSQAEELRHLAAGLREQDERYGELRVPVVLIAGAADQVDRAATQAHPLQQAIPQARLVVLEKTGHAVHHQHPEVVLDAIGWMR